MIVVQVTDLASLLISYLPEAVRWVIVAYILYATAVFLLRVVIEIIPAMIRELAWKLRRWRTIRSWLGDTRLGSGRVDVEHTAKRF